MNIGEAIQQNPGFLKLRKIQAAQKIAKTVSVLIVQFYRFIVLISVNYFIYVILETVYTCTFGIAINLLIIEIIIKF